jgi:hypothetical protein
MDLRRVGVVHSLQIPSQRQRQCLQDHTLTEPGHLSQANHNPLSPYSLASWWYARALVHGLFHVGSPSQDTLAHTADDLHWGVNRNEQEYSDSHDRHRAHNHQRQRRPRLEHNEQRYRLLAAGFSLNR